jgi:hypothetical protein
MVVDQVQMYCPHCARSVLGHRPAASHDMHLVLTMFTLGAWLPAWLLVSIYQQAQPYACSVCGSAGPRPHGPALFILVGGGIGFLVVAVWLYAAMIFIGLRQTREARTEQWQVDEGAPHAGRSHQPR